MSAEKHVVCTACAAVNRLPPHKPAREAKCGKCGEPLFSGHPVDVDAAAFDRHVSRGSLPVLVDVWAPWCGPCRMMAPAFQAAARDLEPGMRLVKLNSDEEQALAGRLGIRGIPTMILYHDGKELARTSGAMSASQIVAWARERLPGLGA
jgi:thioredoxin 2